MKTIAKIAFIGFMMYLVLTGQAITKVSLQKALDKKMVKVMATCKGGLELTLNCRNLLKDSLSIIIPVGWRFNSDAGKTDYQDILLTEHYIVNLKGKEIKNSNVIGYCCEATKLSPQDGVKYTVGKLADSNLVVLARFLQIKKVDNNTQQYSVWAISDGKETSNITASNDSVASLVRNFVSVLKGEPLPWYTLLKKANFSDGMMVNDKPIRFKANIEANTTNKCYSYCYVTDEKGTIVSAILGNWLYPDKPNYNAMFNVFNLKKGTYHLVLESNNKALFQKEFKI